MCPVKLSKVGSWSMRITYFNQMKTSHLHHRVSRSTLTYHQNHRQRRSESPQSTQEFSIGNVLMKLLRNIHHTAVWFFFLKSLESIILSFQQPLMFIKILLSKWSTGAGQGRGVSTTQTKLKGYGRQNHKMTPKGLHACITTSLECMQNL